jgi:cytidylate kinase
MKEYICDICDKIFNKKSHFDAHIRRKISCKKKDIDDNDDKSTDLSALNLSKSLVLLADKTCEKNIKQHNIENKLSNKSVGQSVRSIGVLHFGRKKFRKFN